MNGITKFFGEIITKLRLGWLVEKFSVNSFAVYLGSILVLIMIAVVFVIAIKKAKQKKLQKEDYIYYIGMVVYLLIAFFVLNTKLFGIGNDVDTIAYILLLIIVPLVLMIKYKNEQQKRIIKEKELVECKRILEVQKEQVVDSKKYYDNIRSIKHDINNHIKTMEMLVANSKDEECAEYLNQIKESIGQIEMRSDTGNPYIDAIFTEVDKRAKSKGIRLMISCEGKLDKLKDSLAVCVVISNVLNNALEACERLNKNIDKIIDINLVCRGDVILVVKNSCDDLIVEEGQLRTAKEDKENHGIGLQNIESSVKALGGIMQWKHSPKERMFTFMASWCQ